MSYGNIDGTFNPKSIRVLGNKVALRKLEKYHERINDGIFIPESVDAGFRLNKAIIENISESASKTSGLQKGDTVVYDIFSVFYDTNPIVVTNLENIIYKLDENEDIIPLPGFVLYRRLELNEVEELCENNTSIVLPDRDKVYSNFGEIIKYSTACKNIRQLAKYKYIVIDTSNAVHVILKDRAIHLVPETDILGFIENG